MLIQSHIVRWRKNTRKVDEIPFDFNRRRMSVVIKDNEGKTQLITKGAVEEMLKSISLMQNIKVKLFFLRMRLKRKYLLLLKN